MPRQPDHVFAPLVLQVGRRQPKQQPTHPLHLGASLLSDTTILGSFYKSVQKRLTLGTIESRCRCCWIQRKRTNAIEPSLSNFRAQYRHRPPAPPWLQPARGAPMYPCCANLQTCRCGPNLHSRPTGATAQRLPVPLIPSLLTTSPLVLACPSRAAVCVPRMYSEPREMTSTSQKESYSLETRRHQVCVRSRWWW